MIALPWILSRRQLLIMRQALYSVCTKEGVVGERDVPPETLHVYYVISLGEERREGRGRREGGRRGRREGGRRERRGEGRREEGGREGRGRGEEGGEREGGRREGGERERRGRRGEGGGEERREGGGDRTITIIVLHYTHSQTPPTDHTHLCILMWRER